MIVTLIKKRRAPSDLCDYVKQKPNTIINAEGYKKSYLTLTNIRVHDRTTL